MENWQETPLTFGEVLDVTFRIIKENFSKLLLIMLIFLLPIYLLQAIGLMSGGMSLLPGPNSSTGIAALLERFTQPGVQGAYSEPGTTQTVLFAILSLLAAFIAIPMAYASIIIATEQIRKKETVNISATIKRAFSRFWALFGGSIVFGLVVFGLYIGVAVIVIVSLATGSGLNGLTGVAAGNTAGLGANIAVAIVLAIIGFLAMIYLITRWSFFFAAIVFEKVSPGLGKSWKLTRGYFWRLLGLYFMVGIINATILGVLQVAVGMVLGGSILGYLVNSLFSILISIMPATAFAVTYFDLRVRNEGADLKEMLETYRGNANPSNPAASVVTNQLYTQTADQLPGESKNRSEGMS